MLSATDPLHLPLKETDTGRGAHLLQLEGKQHNRTWTISSHPDESAETQSFTISVKKAGLISSYLHEKLKPGSVIEWRGALGDFTPIAGDRPVLLVAGGIGECTSPVGSHWLLLPKACPQCMWAA